MSDETTLLPCPFCGGEAEIRERKVHIKGGWFGKDHRLMYQAKCTKCGACVGEYQPALIHRDERTGEEHGAVITWNTRAELGSEINGDTSDGYHTFNELYHHRAVLFSVIVRDHRELAWKARKHHDGTMYDGMFIVGIETPKGQATYHYDLDPYWDVFDCEEREFAPEWDGHTPDEAIARIAELGSGTCKLEPLSALSVTLSMLGQTEWGACSECGCAVPMDAKFCNECGEAVER